MPPPPITNAQLYLAIGAPIVANAILLTFLMLHMSSRFTSLETAMNQRFTDLKDLWRAELHRVEEVIDARLKHLEER